MTDSPTFIVADDHPLFRNALRQTLEPHFPDVRIVEAGTLDEVVAAIEATEEPDLVLFDLNMPGARGFSGLMYLRAQYPAVPVCVVSASEDRDTIRRSLALGATGFVPKSSSPAEIRQAIGDLTARLDAARPRPWRPRARTPWRPGSGALRRSSSRPDDDGEGLLTSRSPTAQRLRATVKAHVSRAQKLGVANRTKAVLSPAAFDRRNGRVMAARSLRPPPDAPLRHQGAEPPASPLVEDADAAFSAS